MQFTDVIDRRRSMRAYSAKVVPKSKLDAVLATVRRAPSAGDLQGYPVIIVESPETNALLAEARPLTRVNAILPAPARSPS
jgi:nitroreductase